MGTDCKSAAFQLRWFESTRAHKKTASVEIRWRFSVCRRFGFPCGWIRTASTRRIVRRGKKPLRGFFRCAARVIHPRPKKKRRRRDTLAVFCLQRMAWLLSGEGRMPSRWSGGVLSRHCPEVERESSIFTVFEELCF